MTGVRRPGGILLVSCYELGHAPHGIAMPLAFLRRAGFQPAALDLAVDGVDDEAVARAAVIAVSVPMHTSLRLALAALPRLRALAPAAAIGFLGHYAVLHRELLLEEGAAFALGGELEDELVAVVEALERGERPAASPVSLVRLRFPAPDRAGVGDPARYARLIADGDERPAGYTETTRGCLDTCRHCPVPAVYRGRLFAIARDTVLADIEAQVAAGARHITFGDPDFLNGPRHGLAIARELHRRHPDVTFDVTAQVAHLLRHRDFMPELVELGCAFATTAVESLSDRVLAALGKRHRRGDVERVLELAGAAGLALRPTLVAFTPWTTLADMVELVEFVADRDLVDAVAPVQLSIRLLVPPGSLLLADPALRGAFGPLDRDALGHPWSHPDRRMDRLQADIAEQVARDARDDGEPAATFAAIRRLVRRAAGLEAPPPLPPARRRAPRLSEPWFC